MNETADIPDNLYAAFRESALRFADRPALREGDRSRTYGELDARVRRLAGVLIARFGVVRGETVALFAEKCFEWPVVSLALQVAGAVEYPRECSLDQAALADFFAGLSLRLVFVQSDDILGRVTAALPDSAPVNVVRMETGGEGAPEQAPAGSGAGSGPRVFDLDVLIRESTLAPEPLDELLRVRGSRVGREDPAAIIRTSGTTGPPKLVRLSHGNFLHNMLTLPEAVGQTPSDRVLSCLPAWHLYARIVEYTALVTGSEIVYCQIPEIEAALVRFRPTVFPGFPEIWERAFHKILTGVGRLPLPVRLTFEAFLFVSRRRYAGRERMRGCGWRLNHSSLRRAVLRLVGLLERILFEPAHQLGELIFYRRVRALFGGNLRVAIIGDAPLPRFIDENLRALGFRVLEGYGSTEQNVTAVRDYRCNAVGTAGRPLPGTTVKIFDDAGALLPSGRIGRIAVSGPAVFQAYAPGPPGTPRPVPVFTTEGERRFYFTGDVGLLDDAGNLRLIGREKNRYILAGGGMIYPERIENVLRGSRFVSQVAVTGRDRPYLCALIVPDVDELVIYLRRRLTRRTGKTRRSLFHEELDERFADRPEFLERIVRLPAVQRLFAAEVRRLTDDSDLEVYEVPHRIILVGTPFVPGQELTPTLKLRRSIIEEKFYAQLDGEYESGRFAPARSGRLRLALVRAKMRMDREK